MCLLKLFQCIRNGNKVALLIAGYSGFETRLAGKVIENRWTEFSGNEVEISGDVYVDAGIVSVE